LKDMTIEVDLREIKNLLSELNKKIDILIEEKETLALMALAEKPLKDFLKKEPDIYTVKDIKAKVSCS
jgi:predicted nucleotidyltransferase